MNQHSTIEIVASFEDGLEAFKYLQDHEVDVVFLDIQIPAIDGLLLAKNLHKSSHRPTSSSSPPTRSSRWRRSSWRRSIISSSPTTSRASSICCKSSNWRASPSPQGAESGTPAEPHGQPGEGAHHRHPREQIYYAEADEKLTYVYTRTDRCVMTMTLSEFVQPGCPRRGLPLSPLLLRQHQQDPRDSALVQQHLSHPAP